ncbi:MarR family winged helix-turn-helix transcriptional regulator [Peribacillus simplex]|uniref:MarR family winged helix-turn-helix transcriptional regulator n=1 Tax=Peribacillus simplex TaxID=1478 RepID=UPI003D27B957
MNNIMKDTFEMLNLINNSLIKEYEALLEIELTPKQSLLLDYVHKSKLTVNELAYNMNITASAVSQLVKRMEKDHYVKREINTQNRREINVLLDWKGIKIYETYDEIDKLMIEKYYSKLEEDEVKQLNSIVKKLSEYVLNE